MLEPMPSSKLYPCGFQAAANVDGLNQNQPIRDSKPTGIITPQTVIEPIRPVQLGPPKFATVVNQSKTMTPTQVATGVDDSQGKKLAR
jgi:hypothetical protein